MELSAETKETSKYKFNLDIPPFDPKIKRGLPLVMNDTRLSVEL